MNKKSTTTTDFNTILLLIEEAKTRVYAKANAELVMLYFNVGKIVSHKVSEGIWGNGIVQDLANFITANQPQLTGFNRRGLYRMKQFYETYSINAACFLVWVSINKTGDTLPFLKMKGIDNQLDIKVSALPTQFENLDILKVSAAPTQLEQQHIQFMEVLLKLNWASHLEILSSCKKAEEQLYYIMNALVEKLTMRELRRQIKTATFERTQLQNEQTKIISNALKPIPQHLFKDPYIFEFLDLPEGHSEKDFEKAIIKNLQKFIIEVGKGFTYMGHQYKLQVGNKDFSTDLLFYHRDLQCLVLFELKIEEFEPEFLGKLNFYLESLDRDVKRPHENPSIGVLLCKGKDKEVVEYAMARNTSPAIIAEYETKLIDKKLLANKLNQLAELLTKRE